jgi:hypothetical protein
MEVEQQHWPQHLMDEQKGQGRQTEAWDWLIGVAAEELAQAASIIYLQLPFVLVVEDDKHSLKPLARASGHAAHALVLAATARERFADVQSRPFRSAAVAIRPFSMLESFRQLQQRLH